MIFFHRPSAGGTKSRQVITYGDLEFPAGQRERASHTEVRGTRTSRAVGGERGSTAQEEANLVLKSNKTANGSSESQGPPEYNGPLECRTALIETPLLHGTGHKAQHSERQPLLSRLPPSSIEALYCAPPLLGLCCSSSAPHLPAAVFSILL